MARPKDKHDQRLPVMLTKRELDNLQHLADMRGETKSEVLRKLLAKEVTRMKRRADNGTRLQEGVPGVSGKAGTDSQQESTEPGTA